MQTGWQSQAVVQTDALGTARCDQEQAMNDDVCVWAQTSIYTIVHRPRPSRPTGMASVCFPLPSLGDFSVFASSI